jgi:hypothetical protein
VQLTHLLHDDAAEAVADEDDGDALTGASVRVILRIVNDTDEIVLPGFCQLLQ